MFSSKNKKQQSQVEVSIETMEGNLKGSPGESLMVGYDSKNDKTASTSTTPVADENQKVEEIIEKTPFKTPFSSSLPTSPGSTGLKSTKEDSKGFTMPPKGEVPTIGKETGGGGDSMMSAASAPFLHQDADKHMATPTGMPKTEIPKAGGVSTPADKKMPIKKKKSGISSFIWIILFIGVLAGILLGGYYFYMSKSDSDKSVAQTPVKTKPVSDVKTPVTTPVSKPAVKEPVKQEPKTTPEPQQFMKEMITTKATFSQDLKSLASVLKASGSLKSGVMINPVTSVGENFAASSIIQVLQMDSLFMQGEIQEKASLFATEVDGEMRIAVIFELSEIADDKTITARVTKNEAGLLKKMSVLFVDGVKPIVPATSVFSISEDNMGARYANYTPATDGKSVDWNMLSVGSGKLLYFATARRTAKELTNYFMRLNLK